MGFPEEDAELVEEQDGAAFPEGGEEPAPEAPGVGGDSILELPHRPAGLHRPCLPPRPGRQLGESLSQGTG